MSFTLGYTTTPSTSAFASSLNNQNQLGVIITAPSGGAIVQSISCYFGGWNQTTTAAMCIWNTSGTLLANSGYFTAPSFPLAVGAQGWQTQSLTFTLAASTSYYIGWWRDPARSQVWSENNGGFVEWISTNTSGSPGNMGSNVASSGVPGVYCTCNSSGGIPWWTGSRWQLSKCMTWNGSAWIWNPGYFWNGSFWQHNF